MGNSNCCFFNARLQLKNGMCVQKEIVGIKLCSVHYFVLFSFFLRTPALPLPKPLWWTSLPHLPALISNIPVVTYSWEEFFILSFPCYIKYLQLPSSKNSVVLRCSLYERQERFSWKSLSDLYDRDIYMLSVVWPYFSYHLPLSWYKWSPRS